MRFSGLSTLSLAGAILSLVAPTTQASCALTNNDTSVLEYAYAISGFVNNFYASVPVNGSLASAISNSTGVAQAVANLNGLKKSNNLSLEAVSELGSRAPGFTAPDCTFTYPSVGSVSAFARWAYQLENTVSGAFIGAAGFTQSPEVAFLLARLAAQHTAHAIWVGSRVNSTLFMTNASSLVSAYTPEQVLSKSNATGSLGSYIGDCVSAPAEPCSGTLKIGPLEANLTSSGAVSSGASSMTSTPMTGGTSSTAASSSAAST